MKRILLGVFLGAILLWAVTPGLRAQSQFKMKSYYLVLLYKGPAWTAESTEATKELQSKHMANIMHLAQSGDLLLAGPMSDPGDSLRGIFLLDVDSKEKAEALCATDPAVQAGRLQAEVHTWWAADGITYPGHEALIKK